MIRVMINFPFSGYEKGSAREDLFWRIVEVSASHADPVIVVISEDTIARAGGQYARAFLDDPRSARLAVHRTWSVDTCQTWIAGWGVALGMLPCTGMDGRGALMLPRPKDDDRIILLPGDIDAVADPADFFRCRLPDFLAMDGFNDFVIGDFETGQKLAAKDLIDLYGTYPLLAVWFPDIARATRDRTIWKPRSEFINVRAHVLQDMLIGQRKFAYEQTLNMLIHSWNFDSDTWKYRIVAFPLGTFADDPDSRNISGAIDQVERTERMLKMVWREFEFAAAKDEARKGALAASADEQSERYRETFSRILGEKSDLILKQYEGREEASRAIEAAARVTILSFIMR